MITTILFDLSEVYLGGLKGIEILINEKYGTKLKHSTFVRTNAAKQFFLGQITEEAFWENIIHEFRIKNTILDLKDLIREKFEEVDGTRAIIERLGQNGYKLGLLSVHGREWVEYCEKRFDFHKLFHSRLYSFETAVAKPERQAYELLLEKLQAKAEECLFVDDLEINLVPARKLGMKTVLFINANVLEQELVKNGIRL